MKASILIARERLDEAAIVLREKLNIAPLDSAALASLSSISLSQGRWHESLDRLRGLGDPALQVKRAVALPVILDSAEMVQEAREHLRTSIEQVRESGIRLTDPLREVGLTTFYLAYHGIGERDLQRSVAEMYRDVFPALRFEAGHSPGKGSRIRLGVLSAFLCSHTIGKLYSKLFQNLDRDRFELVYLQLGKQDVVSERLARSADRHVRLATSLADSMRQVAREELDILYYPEIGMAPQPYYLAFSRLAPTQCVMWGHPMTTGSPTIDWFVSSADMEVATGESEYTERLVRLPSVTTFFERPPMPPAAVKADFGLPDDATLYACPQTLFKFHPNYDRVLASILEKDPKGLVVLLQPKIKDLQDALTKRWERMHPLLLERSVFIPGMKLERFLAFASVSECLLDPIQFGGGTSTMEFLAVGAPVVTLPQALLRNRISYALYKQMGFEDLIARNEEHYVELAVRLANDQEWRRQMRERALALSAPLFENRAAIEELSNFLASASLN